ncbi:MAG: radical SAM protein [Magnetococcales bacterium]|nr:radical SAM protein [Magnetococcales bacterium]
MTESTRTRWNRPNIVQNPIDPHCSLKIAFVICPTHGQVIDRVTHDAYKPKKVRYTPLGVLSVIASLPEHHQVTLIDASSLGMTIDDILEELAWFQPDILALSVVTYRAWSMTELLRRSEAPIKIVGGPHATYHHAAIRRQGADAVFVGDAEVSMPRWLKAGCPEGVFVGEPVDLNAIPFPDRRILNLDDYRIPASEDRGKLLFDAGDLRLPMFSSKGCPLKCIYCDVQQKRYNTKAPETILREFHDLQRLGVTSIHVLDDTFNLERQRVIQFCRLLMDEEWQMTWSARGILESSEEVVKHLAMAGCHRLHVGIEHLDDNVLKYFRKHQRLKDVRRFGELCRKHDITILGYFVLGAPGETRQYHENLPEMIRELGIHIPFFNILTPLSDTEFYRQLLQDGRIKEDFWAPFIEQPVKDFQIPLHRPPEEERELQETLDHYLTLFT